jgi:hypothetical protein
MARASTKLVCYCCGKPIGAIFALASHAIGGSVDRLFPMLPECAKRFDGGEEKTLVFVQRTKAPR